MDGPGPLMTYWAGLAAFIAPCTLVLVPFFLLYVIGMTVAPGGRALSASVAARWLALGFVPLFVLSWAFPDHAATVLRSLRLLERGGGAALIIFGLSLTGLLAVVGGLSLKGWRLNWRIPLSLTVGATLAAGWTPCVGSTLSNVLGMTGGPQALWASVLLTVYGFGLMTPFLALGFATGWATRWLSRTDIQRWAAPALGAGIIGVGVIIFTGNLRDLTAYFFSLWPGLAI